MNASISEVADSPRAVHSVLNRLLRVSRNEVVVLHAAIGIIDGAERRSRLREQVKRRAIFQRDISAAVVALGGVPTGSASPFARLTAAARGVRERLIGPHEGDAYAACARATEKTAAAYAKALTGALPADVRFGVEQQYAEIECDRSELRRLRWGASPSPLPGERADTPSLSEPADDRALEGWGEDGGAAGARPGPERVTGTIAV